MARGRAGVNPGPPGLTRPLAFPRPPGYAPATPRILSLAPIDYTDWHAGMITVRPWGPLAVSEAAIIEDIGKDFEVVWAGRTAHGDMDTVIMDDAEQYYLARVVE